MGVAIVSMLLGARAHEWSRWADDLRKHQAFLALRPLWRILADACPNMTVLPIRPLWQDALDMRDAHFRLRRQVLDIEDARGVVEEWADAEARAVAEGVAADLEIDGVNPQALVEAALLWSATHRGTHPLAVGRGPRSQQRLSDWPAPRKAGDLWEEVRYFAAVARHMRGSRPFRRTLNELAALGSEEKVSGETPRKARVGGTW